MRLIGLVVVAAVSVLVSAHAAEKKAGPIARYQIEGKFENVVDDVKLAIQDQGLVIDHTSHINDMLVRTGKDLGTTKQVYANAQAFSFCSASVSRQMMEPDPHNIAYCPYVITVYALPKEPNRVYIAYRRPEPTGNTASRQALRKVEELLDGIVRDVTKK